ncbi:hypothetical protein T265_08370 [Opisthorchis viverrini]|uniref:Uncharacterized protein n=1 Tax=Opisthorchis viverrini TaxID=6198 RepID=A0A074Z9B4_OPIVI|nr:hypothetical protein T265_08370 [Opisthorchis viverrini]KER23826.1 hypothetical protein T265_08370 [Opisthorchis viverrini]
MPPESTWDGILPGCPSRGRVRNTELLVTISPVDVVNSGESSPYTRARTQEFPYRALITDRSLEGTPLIARHCQSFSRSTESKADFRSGKTTDVGRLKQWHYSRICPMEKIWSMYPRPGQISNNVCCKLLYGRTVVRLSSGLTRTQRYLCSNGRVHILKLRQEEDYPRNMPQLLSFSCSNLLAPSYYTTRTRHAGWDTVRSFKPRQKQFELRNFRSLG